MVGLPKGESLGQLRIALARNSAKHPLPPSGTIRHIESIAHTLEHKPMGFE